MPLDRPLTAADILNYRPSDSQRLHGFRVYAARLMGEGVRFEKAGNELQAKLRYEKCKAYCKLRGVAFPPFSEGKTALIEQVEQAQEPVKEWVRGEDVVKARPSKNNPTGLNPIKAPRKTRLGKRVWHGDVEACKQRGRMLWFNRLLKGGETEAAMAFARRHNLSVAGQAAVSRTELSGGENSAQRESVTGVDVVSPHSTLTPEPTAAATAPFEVSSPETETRAGPAGNDGQPVAAVPLHKLGLREQLMRQIAEMDAAERAAGIPQVDPPTIVPEPPAPEPVVVAESVVAPVPTPFKPTRTAIVWNFALNPRLARIKFTDTTATEFGSMRLDRTGLKTNDKVEVEISEGVPGPNAIWRELRKRT